MSDLKPCPFCGGKAELQTSPMIGHDGEWIAILCDGVECRVSPEILSCGDADLKAEVITAWNTRATDATIEAQTAEIARLREALTYYADVEGRHPNDGPWGVDSMDFGDVARAALKGASDNATGD